MRDVHLVHESLTMPKTFFTASTLDKALRNPYCLFNSPFPSVMAFSTHLLRITPWSLLKLFSKQVAVHFVLSCEFIFPVRISTSFETFWALSHSPSQWPLVAPLWYLEFLTLFKLFPAMLVPVVIGDSEHDTNCSITLSSSSLSPLAYLRCLCPLCLLLCMCFFL